MLRDLFTAVVLALGAAPAAALVEAFQPGFQTQEIAAVGGEKRFGTTMADVIRFAATDVKGVVIPASGDWLMEEQPVATVAAIRQFLDAILPVIPAKAGTQSH